MEYLKQDDVLRMLEGKINHSEELKKAFASDEKLEAFYTGMSIAFQDIKETIEKYFK